MNYLTIEEILQIHYMVIEDFGGAHGVRSESRLLSVVRAPRQVVFGQEQYKSVYQKTAVYMRNIIGDHPFVDGNKRTAITISGIFLMRNQIKLTAKQAELEDFAVKIATDKLGVDDIADWLTGHTTKN